MTSQIKRLFVAWASNLTDYRSPFPQATLDKIQDAITAGEQTHGGQVKLIIEKSMTLSDILRHKSIRERALELFGKYEIWRTPENVGLLLYINLADKKIEIVVDHGISKHYTDETWQAICQALATQFKQRNFENGLLDAIASINTTLAKHLPRQADGQNTIDDRPIVM